MVGLAKGLLVIYKCLYSPTQETEKPVYTQCEGCHIYVLVDGKEYVV